MRHRFLCAAAVAALLGLGVGRAAADVPRNAEETLPPAVLELKAAAEAYDADDCAKTLRLGKPLLDAPDVSGLSDELAAIGYEIVTYCQVDGDALEDAYPYALKGTTLAHASDSLWRRRLLIEINTKRNEAAIATLEAMAKGHASALNSVPVRWISIIVGRLSAPDAKPLKRRFLAVAAQTYAPAEPFADTSWLKRDYARMLWDDGQHDKALGLVRAITDSDALIETSLDPRFRGAFPADPDVRAVLERSLDRHRAEMQAHPDLLEGYSTVARDLRILGRLDEALKVLDEPLARIGDPKAFTDRAEKLNWFWDERGRALEKLNRPDEAFDAFRKGDASGENAGLNVSQLINLAESQDRFGRGEDALKTLSGFDDPKRAASPYGVMEMRLARFCAYVIAGRPNDGAADLVFARGHEKDHPEALFDMLLCAGDMDGAAAALIRRLDDPDRRVGALRQLSDYDPPPVKLPPDPLEGRLPELKARPDVKAAIARAGGTRRFNIQRGDL